MSIKDKILTKNNQIKHLDTTLKPRNFAFFLIENNIIFPSSILFYPLNIDSIQLEDSGTSLLKKKC